MRQIVARLGRGSERKGKGCCSVKAEREERLQREEGKERRKFNEG